MSSLDLGYFPNPSTTTLRYWISGWGQEWAPQVIKCSERIKLAAESGRSSEQFHPFFVLSDANSSLAIAIPWSGNWSFELDPKHDHIYLSISTDVGDIEPIYAYAPGGNWEDATKALRNTYFPITKNWLVPSMKMEWNHWWPYEASTINETTFLANAKVASECGIEVAVLDAGWFGEQTHGDWEGFRGDWDVVDSEKFPRGLTVLAEETRNLGIEFGMWIEVETIGTSSRVFHEHPDYLAFKDSKYLGYACFGNAQVGKWALDIVTTLLKNTKASWMKFDFNLNPGSGCNRDDHGHDSTEGLAAHIRGLYAFFHELKNDYPEVVLENCSSGGMRWDYGIAPYFDFGFSSDKDWPDHALSVFWASAHFFPLQKILAWCDSEWLNNQPGQDFKTASSSHDRLAFALSIALLGGFGLSQRISDFSPPQKEILRTYSELYKDHFRPRYQAGADIRFLTEQPLRDGTGERTVGFAIEATGYPPILAIYQLSGCNAETVKYPFTSTAKTVNARNLATGERLQFDVIGDHIAILTSHTPQASALYILETSK